MDTNDIKNEKLLLEVNLYAVLVFLMFARDVECTGYRDKIIVLNFKHSPAC